VREKVSSALLVLASSLTRGGVQEMEELREEQEEKERQQEERSRLARVCEDFGGL